MFISRGGPAGPLPARVARRVRLRNRRGRDNERLPTDLTIVRAGVERLDDLEPLWSALQRHHAEALPQVAGAHALAAHESWMRRRAAYLEWLSEPAAFTLVAEREGRAVGYVFVRVAPGWAGWDTGERMGVVETLAVLPEERGRRVGSLLLDEAEAELAGLDVRLYVVSVVAGNEDAIRFYERRSLERCRLTFAGRIEETPTEG